MKTTEYFYHTSQRTFNEWGDQEEPVRALAISQEGIHKEVRKVGNGIAEYANPHGTDTTRAVRALKPGRTTVTPTLDTTVEME